MNDDPTNDDMERRLRDAVSAHTAQVRPDEAGSLQAIRDRASAARRRRMVGATALGAAAALVIGVAIGVSVGDDDDTTTIAAGGEDPTTTTVTVPCPPTTPPPEASTTTIAASSTSTETTIPETTIPETTVQADVIEREADPDCPPSTGPPTTPTTTTTVVDVVPSGVFPLNTLLPPDAPWPWPDPESTARGFLEAIGASDAGLGAFEASDPDAGTISVHPKNADGSLRTDIVRSVLYLQQVDGHWWVLHARSDSIDIDDLTPAPGTLTVSGRGRGFEGTLHIQVIAHGDVAFRKDTIAMASGDIELRPYTATIDVAGASQQYATVVVANESGETGGPSDFAAVAVQLP